MSPEETNQLQALLGQLRAAETALQAAMRAKGFGATARAHLERARTHIAETYVALTEPGQARSVPRLVDDLNRIQQVMETFNRRPIKTHRI
ncbi:hypothetical protein GC207_12980 [bacterium]|nr:hypothetical protein [bacterium]